MGRNWDGWFCKESGERKGILYLLPKEGSPHITLILLSFPRVAAL